MKLLWNDKDGGGKSLVWCWGIESKLFGSILLLWFAQGSRDAYHEHAFNAVSWLLSGELLEEHIDGKGWVYVPSWRPIFTGRKTFHKVTGRGWPGSWVLSFRGPWVDRWREFLPNEQRFRTLTHGRKEVDETRAPVSPESHTGPAEEGSRLGNR